MNNRIYSGTAFLFLFASLLLSWELQSKSPLKHLEVFAAIGGNAEKRHFEFFLTADCRKNIEGQIAKGVSLGGRKDVAEVLRRRLDNPQQFIFTLQEMAYIFTTVEPDISFRKNTYFINVKYNPAQPARLSVQLKKEGNLLRLERIAGVDSLLLHSALIQ